MYRRVLVPLDGSLESERVIPALAPLLEAQSELIFLRVIPAGKVRDLGENLRLLSPKAEAKRACARGYLRGVVRNLAHLPGRRRFEVITATSIPQGIVDYAREENVDLIGMFTRGRSGVSGWVRGRVPEKVRRLTSIEVLVVGPADVLPIPVAGLGTDDYSWAIDVTHGDPLSRSQERILEEELAIR